MKYYCNYLWLLFTVVYCLKRDEYGVLGEECVRKLNVALILKRKKLPLTMQWIKLFRQEPTEQIGFKSPLVDHPLFIILLHLAPIVSIHSSRNSGNEKRIKYSVYLQFLYKSKHHFVGKCEFVTLLNLIG